MPFLSETLDPLAFATLNIKLSLRADPLNYTSIARTLQSYFSFSGTPDQVLPDALAYDRYSPSVPFLHIDDVYYQSSSLGLLQEPLHSFCTAGAEGPFLMSGIAMATCVNVGAFLEDLAKEILLNFYVKSLLRFKCVGKKWSALIKDPKFTIEHLYCSKKKPPQFLTYDYGAHDDAPHVTVISHNGIPSPSQGDNSQRFGSITDLLGSVDGLFFLEREIDRGILVRHLPAATIELQPFDLYGRHFGFGLDTMTKDYKVVYHYLRDKYAAVHYSWKIFKHDVNYN
ncbi:hypothetical protein T459_26875 [Capsicum annuum]|uniref:Uncharacterized protein n=1 Tax=Capsicum annuum TaxID=4072 RepID=A0A2G2YCB0_CAPAN|nr:hypothetical protein T459_26875 [Capsicum annuum]